MMAILFGCLITICSICIPQDYQLTTTKLENLIHELLVPYLLAGDLSAHHPLRGSAHANLRG